MKNIFLIPLFALSAALTPPGYQVGDKVMPFTLRNIDDRMVSLDDFSGQKGIVLVFTCNHCPVSVAYEDRIISLHGKYGPEGFPVVAVNPNDPVRYPDDSFENMKKRAAEKGFAFHYLTDETQEVAKAFGAVRTPHVFLLENKNGKFTVAYIGAIDDNTEGSGVTNRYLERAIEALLSGKKPDPSFTKAVGCSIKWKI